MALTGLQIIGIITLGAFGFRRGWRREFIALAGVLVASLFLVLGFGNIIALALFVGVPLFVQLITNRLQGVKTPTQTPSDPAQALVLITSAVMFLAIVVLGYIIGNKIGPKPKKPLDHFLGIFPAAASGYFLTTFVLNNIPPFTSIPFLNSNWLRIDLSAPDFFGNSVLFIFVLAVIAVVISLMALRAKKS